MNDLVVPICLVLGAASLAVLLPARVFFLAILEGLSDRRNTAISLSKRSRLTVSVTAHNEVTLIAPTIRLIAPQLEIMDRLLVIADNRSDDTAGVAIVEVPATVRTDLGRRGKEYALDYGVPHLEDKPPDIVVFVDADCRVSSEFPDVCHGRRRPANPLGAWSFERHSE